MFDVGHLFAYISLSLFDQEQTAFQVRYIYVAKLSAVVCVFLIIAAGRPNLFKVQTRVQGALELVLHVPIEIVFHVPLVAGHSVQK